MGLKLQCGCGQKVQLDVGPEHAAQGVQFICPTCGVDNSVMATQIVRQLFEPASAVVAPTIPATMPSSPPRVAQPPSGATPSIRVQTVSHAGQPKTAPETPSPSGAPAGASMCAKHYGVLVTNHCLVCQKPLCPKCMEVFGFVCSAFCRQKAEANHIEIPIYEHQSAFVQARSGRRVMRNIFAVLMVLAVGAGVWIWWEWVATVPRTMFSVAFQEKGYSGQARMNAFQQTVILHGGRLARFDLKTGKQLWSQDLLDRKQIAAKAATALEQMKVAREKAISDGADADDWKLPNLENLSQQMIRSEEGALALHVQGENIWVQFPDKLVRYDWQTGSAGKEITSSEVGGRWASKGAELVSSFQNNAGSMVITRLDLTSGELRKDEFARAQTVQPALSGKGRTGTAPVAERAQAAKVALPQPAPGRAPAGGKILLAGSPKPTARGIDPKTAAERFQNMPLSSKLALPAVIAANANQERLKAELRSDSDAPASVASMIAEAISRMSESSFLPAGDGFVELSVKLLETKTVERKVMKAPPKKAALDGEISTGNSMAAANELLNEIQRETLGDTLKEDVSRYQVQLRKAGATNEEWTGEVNGTPQFFALKTMNILAAGDSLIALDKNLKKRWEGKLSSKLAASFADFEETPDASGYGQGPCVERGDRIYVFDQTVLTCYEKASGQPRWRLPSVGTAGLYFDELGHIYVNTTTASPETVKYSRQIDLNAKTRNQIIKLEESTGRILWRTDGEGMIRYLSGKFIYTMEMHEGDSEEGAGLFSGMKTGLEVPAHVRIKRLSPKNGRVLWEHYQARAPLDVQFDKNRIELLFRKELQVLTYRTL